MSKIELKFIYSVELERERIKDTINNTKWFVENGYSEWIKLPGNTKLIDVDEKNQKDVLDKLEEEYSQEDYSQVENTVNEQWFKFSSILGEYFRDINLKPEEFYLIQLTKYGTGGSYHLPNKVIVNFQNKFGIGVSKTIVHEIVHLSIQKIIDAYNVEHWIKERIVDLILSKITPSIATMQKIPIETKKIDDVFNKHYPNIEEVIRNIKQ